MSSKKVDPIDDLNSRTIKIPDSPSVEIQVKSTRKKIAENDLNTVKSLFSKMK